MMHVNRLLNTSAGDERHREENWVECPACSYDNPANLEDCTFCGTTLNTEVDA